MGRQVERQTGKGSSWFSSHNDAASFLADGGGPFAIPSYRRLLNTFQLGTGVVGAARRPAIARFVTRSPVVVLVLLPPPPRPCIAPRFSCYNSLPLTSTSTHMILLVCHIPCKCVLPLLIPGHLEEIDRSSEQAT